MLILSIDPGNKQSGWCLYDSRKHHVHSSGVCDNNEMLEAVQAEHAFDYPPDVLAIEMIASYGMAVGREVFDTCVWVGRFMQAWSAPESVRLVYRKEVKMHLCGTMKAKDANIRQAIIDLFPASGDGKIPQIGTKNMPGPLYGVSSHAWAALGVAITTRG